MTPRLAALPLIVSEGKIPPSLSRARSDARAHEERYIVGDGEPLTVAIRGEPQLLAPREPFVLETASAQR